MAGGGKLSIVNKELWGRQLYSSAEELACALLRHMKEDQFAMHGTETNREYFTKLLIQFANSIKGVAQS